MERNKTCMCHEDIQAHMQGLANSLIGRKLEVYCQDDRCPEHLWEIFHCIVGGVQMDTDGVVLHIAADHRADMDHKLPFNKLAELVECGTTKEGPDKDSTTWWGYTIMENDDENKEE